MTTSSDNEATQPDSKNAKKRNLLVFFIYLFPVVSTSLIFLIVVIIGNISFPTSLPSKGDFGEITSPENRSIIDKKFNISGKIIELPPKQFVYLVEQKDNAVWPKYNLGGKKKVWEKQLTAHGESGQFFNFQLMKVNKDDKERFEKWFERGNQTGKYPGLRDIKSAEVFAEVKVRAK